MEYSHYWRGGNFTVDQWERVKNLTRKILAESDADVVGWDRDPTTSPDVTNYCIRLNGRQDEGHETFELHPESTRFAFCKTARKPYDEVVVAILQGAHEINPQWFNWDSDGDAVDHTDGLMLLERAKARK